MALSLPHKPLPRALSSRTPCAILSWLSRRASSSSANADCSGLRGERIFYFYYYLVFNFLKSWNTNQRSGKNPTRGQFFSLFSFLCSVSMNAHFPASDGFTHGAIRGSIPATSREESLPWPGRPTVSCVLQPDLSACARASEWSCSLSLHRSAQTRMFGEWTGRRGG